MELPKKPAAQYLDQACKAEREGRTKVAEMAFGLAVKADDAEHAGLAPISLPRTAAKAKAA